MKAPTPFTDLRRQVSTMLVILFCYTGFLKPFPAPSGNTPPTAWEKAIGYGLLAVIVFDTVIVPPAKILFDLIWQHVDVFMFLGGFYACNIVLVHPIESLAILIAVVLVAATVFFTSGLSFFSLTLCIVYIGAVSMLFLFVIMLLKVDAVEYTLAEKFKLYGVAIVAASVFSFRSGDGTTGDNVPFSPAAQGGDKVYHVFNAFYGDDLFFYAATLYTQEAPLFLLLTAVILVALICAIVLATSVDTPKSAAVGAVPVATTLWTQGNFIHFLHYVLVAAGICLLLATIANVVALMMKTVQKETDKGGQYECGFNPFDNATRLPFNVQFYLVGILFIIFDVELVALIPWIFSLSGCDWVTLSLIGVFVGALGVGFAYEWARGALNWSSDIR